MEAIDSIDDAKFSLTRSIKRMLINDPSINACISLYCWCSEAQRMTVWGWVRRGIEVVKTIQQACGIRYSYFNRQRQCRPKRTDRMVKRILILEINDQSYAAPLQYSSCTGHTKYHVAGAASNVLRKGITVGVTVVGALDETILAAVLIGAAATRSASIVGTVVGVVLIPTLAAWSCYSSGK